MRDSLADLNEEHTVSLDFIREAIVEDTAAGRFHGQVQTRFPPEPNGYLHIGHAKAICLNFDVAAEFGGVCNLRFDDTNPLKEEQEFVDAQLEDIRWLGYEPANVYYASDYFAQLYQWAIELIQKGLAYVDDLSQEEIRAYRGTLTEPGRESPYRERSIEENLDLFRRMKEGEFADGAKVLRAKIDMVSPNINLRDPVMYRIRHVEHQRTGDEWCIYPMYDWAHGQSDSIEGVTHSLCSLEYLNHRPLYDWYLGALEVYHPQQLEFAKLNFTYTVTSKRRLLRLVQEGYVNGWDDPRMPTLAGQRRRGVAAKALRDLCDHVGIARTNSTVAIDLLEYYIRQELNRTANRVMGVLTHCLWSSRISLNTRPNGWRQSTILKTREQAVVLSLSAAICSLNGMILWRIRPASSFGWPRIERCACVGATSFDVRRSSKMGRAIS